ncbi:MAG: KAP family P-loop NTPase fold protein [Oscillochloridaceae bacterium umkhey_bin13]
MTHIPPGYGDLPATQDELGFTPAAQALATIITGADIADTPLTLGIYGPWGSGKTSLMQMIYQPWAESEQPHPTVLPVWFDAWRFAQSDALWRALLITVIEAIRKSVVKDEDRLRTLLGKPEAHDRLKLPADRADAQKALEQRLDDLIAGLYRTVEREELGGISIDWPEAGKAAAGTAIRVGLDSLPFVGAVRQSIEELVGGAGGNAAGLAKAIRRERAKIYRDQITSLEQFYKELQALIQTWTDLAGYRLVVFIDDLDRCLPEQAIGVLEALKVFLDIRGCVFVLGVDREIIERGIRVRYKEFALAGADKGPFPVAERDYLEKIVQVPFTLPPLAPQAISRFLSSRLPHVAELSDEERTQVAALMTTGLLRNPRKVKRSFNIFRLHLSLDRAQGRTTPAGLLAKLTVIQSSFPDIYERLAKEPALLKSIEAIARGIGSPTPIPQALRDELSQQDPRLREMLHQPPWYEHLSDEAIAELVYQSRVTEDGTAAPSEF